MGMWNCDVKDCNKVSVRTYGECVLCARHLCAKHLGPEYHKCPKWEDEKKYDPAFARAEQAEITKLLNKINTDNLSRQASSLRKGISCSIIPQTLEYDPSTKHSMMGGMNIHIEILFEDGISWLARIRRSNATSPPLELRNYIMLSEVATLKFLSERTNVPAPRVFHFDLDENETNPVGVGYILMQRMPGRSLPLSDHHITREQKKKVVGQLADIYIELHAHPFDSIGSLNLPGFNKKDIGPFAQESLADYQDSVLKTHGPFPSPNEYFETYINFILGLILRQEAYTNNPVDAFLIHRYLLESIPSIFPDDDGNGLDDGKFYLKHANDKGDEILVDDDFNITGIVDWEWAHTAPKSTSFKSPLALLPVGLFYSGDNTVGDEELEFAGFFDDRGRRDLGEIIRNGRLLHQLEFCCGYDLLDWDSYPGIFMGLVRGLSIDGKSDGLEWETWRAEALKRYSGHHQLQSLLRFQDRSRPPQ